LSIDACFLENKLGTIPEVDQFCFLDCHFLISIIYQHSSGYSVSKYLVEMLESRKENSLDQSVHAGEYPGIPD
jgi:hypothetical protein